MNRLFLGLGANRSGRWGTPAETLERTCGELTRAGVRVVVASRVYTTRPLGTGRQPPFLNAVLLAHASLGPAALLRVLKGLERRAGRRLGVPWGPRALDIDILDFGGRRLAWPAAQRRRGGLTLPHPEMHRRAFVLVPLLEVAPHWRHPVLGLSARRLLSALAERNRRGVSPSLAFRGAACEKRISTSDPREQRLPRAVAACNVPRS